MQILSQSENIKSEYCASVVRIGELKPVPNSDFLAFTYINEKSIVVRKDMVKSGDLMFYAENETELNPKFLGVNNLYEATEFQRNANSKEIANAMSELAKAKKNEDAESIAKWDSFIKENTGFFTKQSRVRMIRLRGVASQGFLFSKECMVKYCKDVEKLNLEDYVGKDFDTVNGELFIKDYVPQVQESRNKRRNTPNIPKKSRFDKVIDGQLRKHYDTNPFGKNKHLFFPDTKISVSTKVHGTSAIFANVLTNRLKAFVTPFGWLTDLVNKIHRHLPHKFQKIEKVYDVLYSSRKVILNQYVDLSGKVEFTPTDKWHEYYELLKDYIPQGMTLYGEIFGYETGLSKMIQKNYDYGCEVGKNKFMPYRITMTNANGKPTEWEVSEVREWTLKLMKEHPEIADRIFPIDILYEGTIENLYPNLDKSDIEKWQEQILGLMSNEKRWSMEKKEPLCNNKVPREGVVIRIIGDPVAEAFKLKTVAFAEKERDLIDKGEIDVEMMENL